MEPVTLFNYEFKEIGPLRISADIEVGNSSASNDFEITSEVPADCNGIAVLGTEAGGVIEYVDVFKGKIPTLKGWTWRGLLTQIVLCPPSGSDYLTIENMECNAAISSVLNNKLGGFFIVPSTDTGVTIESFQFNLYTDALSGLISMLYSVGMRLYTHAEKDDSTRKIAVYIEAKPITTISGEYDDDSQLKLEFTSDQMKYNHMICMGKGELQERARVDLYIQNDGSIGTEPYYTGFQERQYYYNDSSAEDPATLEVNGRKKFAEICNTNSLTINSEPEDLEVGDIIKGTYRAMGISVESAVTKKIYRITGDRTKIEYTIKEE